MRPSAVCQSEADFCTAKPVNERRLAMRKPRLTAPLRLIDQRCMIFPIKGLPIATSFIPRIAIFWTDFFGLYLR